MENELTIASFANTRFAGSFTERGEDFVIEVIDLDADYRENVEAFDVVSDRLEGWAIWDRLVARFN